MIRAIYFSLCFAIAFLGLVVAIHIELWLGLSMFSIGIVKFWLQLPTIREVENE